jgi:simple sugar transport system substrate-binding protein
MSRGIWRHIAVAAAVVGLVGCSSQPSAAPSVANSSAAPSVGNSSAAPSVGNGGTGAGGTGAIAVIGYESQSSFWLAEAKGAAQAAKDFGVTVNYAAPQTASDQGMIQLATTALATKPYGICLDYLDHAMFDVTKQALAAGVHVGLYNNNLFQPEAGGATTDPAITTLPYVGQTNAPGGGKSSGEVLGEAFAKYLPQGGGLVLIVNPFPQAFVLTLRYQAVKAALEPLGYTTDQLVAGADEGQNLQTITAYLAAHSNVVGVVGLGTPAANPAASYMKAHNLKIPVATFDVDPEAFNNIKAGLINVAVFQQPFLQSYLCVENMVLLGEGFLPVNVDTGNSIIDSSNVDIVGKLIAAGKS